METRPDPVARRRAARLHPGRPAGRRGAELQEDLAERIVATGARGVVIDISAVEIVDSFIGRMFATIASLSKVLDAETVVVGMRSHTSLCTLAATTLIIEISWRAARLPSVSIFQAACSTISRAPSISIARLRDEVLDELLLGQRARRTPRARSRAGTSSRARARPRRSRACSGGSGPARAASWAIKKPAPRAPSRFSSGTRQSSYLISQWPGPPSMAHHRHRAHEVEARRVGGHEDHARALVRRGVGVGHDHRDRDAAPIGARGEPLVAVDDPLVAVELGASGAGRVRARRLGLGHREAAADVPFEQRLQPALLLLRRAVLDRISMFPVSGAEQLKTMGATGRRPMTSQSIPYSQLVEAGAVLLVGQEEVPESLGLRALAQLHQDLR